MNKNQAAFLSIISNTILIIFKLFAGIFMNSISVISEAIHSSIDLLASLIAYFSIKKASKAVDDDHPFGHGKYENVSGFVEALLILLAAVLIIIEAIKKLIHGSDVENLNVGIFVMIAATLVNFVISSILLKISKKTESIALEADGMHLLTDVMTSMGVFVGLIIIKITKLPFVDSLTALFVAALILKTSIDLIRKSLKDLVDSSLDTEDINKILNVLKLYPEIKSYHKLRTRMCGNTREIDLHLQIDETESLVSAHNLCNAIEEDIGKVFPNSYVLIHMEPYINNK
ncbi:MAG: cation diffusion facilitator family transporter [Bacillota bacterium]|nr:cation diffusion facilitator family transporter [Bacillota bacterium]